MIKTIKLFLFNRRTWVYNLQYIFYSLILLAIVTYIDNSVGVVKDFIPDFFFTRLGLAKSVLSSLSSGLLSITIFTFSTILSILTFYSGNFSPRVVENFVGHKITMKVLGIFIGGFVYCITSLNFMRSFEEERFVVAGTVAILYAMVCVVYLVIFIQKTVRDVQVTNLLNDIYEDTLPLVIKEVQERDFDQVHPDLTDKDYQPVYSKTSGYFELFNTGSAIGALGDFSGVFLITKKTGDFILENEEIGRLMREEEDPDLQEKLVSAFEIHPNKIAITDYHYGLEKMLEIGLMALSPGVNDPMTAVYCLKKLSILLGKLASVNEFHHIEKLKNGGYIYSTTYQFEEDVYFTVFPLANYGKSDIQVVKAIFECFIAISSSATMRNKQVLLRLAEDLYQGVAGNFVFERDKKLLEDTYVRFQNYVKHGEE